MTPDRSPRPTRRPPARRGVTPAEVLVALALVLLAFLMVLMALPRQRENARLAGCRRNLMQIGVAVALYGRADGRLPTVPRLAADPPPSGGPLKALLDVLEVPNLTEMRDPARPPAPIPGQVPAERFLAGFVCPSDPNTPDRGQFPAPVSYRATAGDQPEGVNGGFAPGRALKAADVEAGDGQSFTAAFSERLRGGLSGSRAPLSAYQVVPGPLAGGGCPDAAGPGSVRTDAGRSWAEASWRSTLYHHALPPGGVPSCVSDDGSSAFMGVSSGHAGGVNVLMFDGSVRTVTPTVALPVWRGMATTGGDAGPVAPAPEFHPTGSDGTGKESPR